MPHFMRRPPLCALVLAAVTLTFSVVTPATAGDRAQRPASTNADAARRQLASLSIPFTPDAFIAQAHKGAIDIVRLFLDAGMDVNVNPKDDHGLPMGTALEAAAGYGAPKVVQLLLDRGARVDEKDWVGNTPLNFACSNVDGANPDVVRLLLEHGADPNSTRSDRWTPLLHAASSDCVECVRLLLQRGANPNAKTDNGWTALALADNEEIRRLLRAAGARQ